MARRVNSRGPSVTMCVYKKGLIFSFKIREKGQFQKLPDKDGYTWTPGVDPPGFVAMMPQIGDYQS